jgi:hypothetical protein
MDEGVRFWDGSAWSVLVSPPRRRFARYKEKVMLKLTMVLSGIAVTLTGL